MTKTPLLALLAGAMLATTASAQTAQDIVNRVDAAQRAAKDISFRLSGSATLDAGSQKIDLLVRTIPAQTLVRVQFNAPDALADNIFVADKNEIRQYLYLTNQITVTPVKKAADGAGLGGLDFTQLTNTATLLKSFDVKLLGTSGAAGKRLYQLEATPRNGEGTDRTRVWISEDGWRPTRIQVVSGAGKPLADMTVSSWRTNSGLTTAALRQLPRDAQVVRQ